MTTENSNEIAGFLKRGCWVALADWDLPLEIACYYPWPDRPSVFLVCRDNPMATCPEKYRGRLSHSQPCQQWCIDVPADLIVAAGATRSDVLRSLGFGEPEPILAQPTHSEFNADLGDRRDRNIGPSARPTDRILGRIRRAIGWDIAEKVPDKGWLRTNSKASVLGKFEKLGKSAWRKIHRHKREDIFDHTLDIRTYGYTSDGSMRTKEGLACVDVDCKLKGVPVGTSEGAERFVEWLKRTTPLLSTLFHEPSTNGTGRHGYLWVTRGGSSPELLNRSYASLQAYLKRRLAEYQRIDPEAPGDVEIKGHAPEIGWQDGIPKKIKMGQIAKLPRECLRRWREWEATPRVSIDQIIALTGDMPVIIRLDGSRVTLEEMRRIAGAPGETPAEAISMPTPADETSAEVISIPIAKPTRTNGYTGIAIPKELAEQIEGKNSLVGRIANNCGMVRIETKSGRKVRDVDVRVFCILLHFSGLHPNEDGSFPVARAEALWNSLVANGYTDRPWNHERWKAMRDWASDHGWITWVDNGYVEGSFDESGYYHKGYAMKWGPSEFFMSLWEERIEEQGKEGASYYTLPTLPPEIEERLQWQIACGLVIRSEYRGKIPIPRAA
jgi:hypothetical protein